MKTALLIIAAILIVGIEAIGAWHEKRKARG